MNQKRQDLILCLYDLPLPSCWPQAWSQNWGGVIMGRCLGWSWALGRSILGGVYRAAIGTRGTGFVGGVKMRGWGCVGVGQNTEADRPVAGKDRERAVDARVLFSQPVSPLNWPNCVYDNSHRCRNLELAEGFSALERAVTGKVVGAWGPYRAECRTEAWSPGACRTWPLHHPTQPQPLFLPPLLKVAPV